MNTDIAFRNPTPESLIDKVRFRTEQSRLIIAAITVIFLILPVVLPEFSVSRFEALSGVSTSDKLIVVGGFLLFSILIIWIVGAYVRTKYLMNLIEVNKHSFEDVHDAVERAKKTIGYEKEVDVYIASTSEAASMKVWRYRVSILRFLDHRLLVINSEVLTDDAIPEELDFIIMFHIARLKTRTAYFSAVTELITYLERFKVLNFLLFPFERATVYTADRVASIYIGSISEAQKAIARNMLGNELGRCVNVKSLVAQQRKCNPFFAWLVRAYSPYPGYSYRLAELEQFVSPVPLVRKTIIRAERKSYEYDTHMVTSAYSEVDRVANFRPVSSSGIEWKLLSSKFGEIILNDTDSKNIVIGRDKELCDYAIPKMKISRQHLRLSVRNDELFVDDLNSTNGTYVNGKKVNSGKLTILHRGDKLNLSKYAEFRLV